ncbi:hypothetical protein HL658_31365 [Azospirillum sp. RWY-5-1]|uniref:DUF1834 domain-containing protein n=1 Tax=Azospirillum oleiclasticum TaxID=2735135 RepID=A0ABX2TJG4_9PROT|nr:hypothetical protein [Azospirillum oleiclasticum]NYZ17065.1 hypothetical protein [Azospirillum oleiclasticum]NYZ24491.1 hypothetical protein [Azospirillum oleiclasticum]
MTDPVRAAIVAALETVPAIGAVHAFERYAPQSQAMQALYRWTNPDTGAAEIRGWFVSLVSERYGAPRAGRGTVVGGWLITGLLAVQDAAASELTIAALARAVVARLAADPTLGGTVGRLCDGRNGPATDVGAQIERIEPVMFAGVLCHRARLSLVTERFQ